MSMFEMNNCNCGCATESTIVTGNSLDLDVNYCEAEIRADVVVSEYNSVRLWGQIINCEGKPVPNALIKLLKVECKGKQVSYKGIAHTISDCEGFYQFELCGNHDKSDCYKLLVSKAAYGPERIINSADGNCDPCNPNNNSFDPCKEYSPIITPPGSCCDNNTDCGCTPTYYSKRKY
ncbi:hypothetical protein [Clostridium sp.]|uniref:hypothetical protein n=1 Tax=Clostridium sp. TaxID=1506 RepID=UPI003EE7A889